MCVEFRRNNLNITAADIRTIFSGQIDILETMVDEIFNADTDLVSLFSKILKRVPKEFEGFSTEKKAGKLFAWYVQEQVIKPIQQDKRYSTILKVIQSHLKNPNGVNGQLKTILLERVKLLHSYSLEDAISNALSKPLKRGLLSR